MDLNPTGVGPSFGPDGVGYDVLGRLAIGGMAELYLARPRDERANGQVVVLKRILPHLAEDPEFVRMFRDEAHLAATLDHPNIVRVFDIGRQDADHFFTMEYVHGENLRAILRAAKKRNDTQVPLQHVLTIMIGVTAALHYAHERTDGHGRPLKIVHRDVSPTNILVGFDGAIKILDFGIAKAAAATHVTQAGMLKGKAAYMSPEQCRAQGVDRRSDIYAIGILLYELSTFARLFQGENEIAILHQVLTGAITPPSSHQDNFPLELERILFKALDGDPDQRYQTARDLQEDLQRFAMSEGIAPSRDKLRDYMFGLFGERPLPWLVAVGTTLDNTESPSSGSLEPSIVESNPSMGRVRPDAVSWATGVSTPSPLTPVQVTRAPTTALEKRRPSTDRPAVPHRAPFSRPSGADGGSRPSGADGGSRPSGADGGSPPSGAEGAGARSDAASVGPRRSSRAPTVQGLAPPPTVGSMSGESPVPRFVSQSGKGSQTEMVVDLRFGRPAAKVRTEKKTQSLTRFRPGRFDTPAPGPVQVQASTPSTSSDPPTVALALCPPPTDALPPHGDLDFGLELEADDGDAPTAAFVRTHSRRFAQTLVADRPWHEQPRPQAELADAQPMGWGGTDGRPSGSSFQTPNSGPLRLDVGLSNAPERSWIPAVILGLLFIALVAASAYAWALA